MEKKELERRRQEILRKMGEMRTMRRGTVSEQFLKVGHKGQREPVERGPYYLWQHWEKGIPKRQRLRAGAEVEVARQEVAAFKAFKELCDEYVRVAEALAAVKREKLSDDALKKTRKWRSSRTPR